MTDPVVTIEGVQRVISHDGLVWQIAVSDERYLLLMIRGVDCVLTYDGLGYSVEINDENYPPDEIIARGCTNPQTAIRIAAAELETRQELEQ
jgi:hypothetical protein